MTENDSYLFIRFSRIFILYNRERNGAVVECLSRDRKVADSSLTTAPRTRKGHINIVRKYSAVMIDI